jgi:hypothetical protein
MLIVLVAALYSCSGQYDNIEQYAVDETVYVGKFSDDPYVEIGYKRLEIELMGDSIGRVYSDDLYLGKAKKTVIEYDEADGRRKLEFDSVCSWVNIKGLTTPKTYIFTIYAEDEYGHRSIPVEALGKPFTDADFEGIAFPVPRIIPAPTTVEFIWDEASMGLSSPLFKMAELIYSYIDKNGKTVSGMLTPKNAPTFNIKNLNLGDSTTVIINCRIIPIVESGQILDTLPLVKEFVTATITGEEYLKARGVRPIVSALIHNGDESKATITFGPKTDHLVWTDIRYQRSNGNWSEPVRVENGTNTLLCTDIKRNVPIQISCAFSPPETDNVFISEWEDSGPFIIKYDPRFYGWSVAQRTANHVWSDGQGSQTLWPGGHPMSILDDDMGSGWHSKLSIPFPHVLIIDMQESRRVAKIIANHGGYWKTVELYLTNNLSIDGYISYQVIWDDNNRVANYSNWHNTLTNLIPENVPAAWGSPIPSLEQTGNSRTFVPPSVLEGRFLILRFSDNDIGWETYINVNNFEVYGD